MTTSLVVAITEDNGMGKNNNLPWFPKAIKGDMSWFKLITTSKFKVENGEFKLLPKDSEDKSLNTVVMGRKTWESIPLRFRPLPQRKNVVLTRAIQEAPTKADITYSSDFNEYLTRNSARNTTIYIIGGANIYDVVMDCDELSYVFVTQMLKGSPVVECDVFFPIEKMARFPHKIDISQEVYENLKANSGFDLGTTHFHADERYFEESNGYKYKMYLFHKA